ncbi:MAG: YncE family protein [Bacteroidota bacterium]
MQRGPVRAVGVLLAVIVLAGCEVLTVGDESADLAPSPGTEAPLLEAPLYVAHRGRPVVSVIDQATNQVAAVVDLSTVGVPTALAVAPDASAWYVALGEAGQVVRYDARNELVDAVAINQPGLLAVAPGGRSLLITQALDTPTADPFVLRLTPATQRLDTIRVNSARPHGVAIQASQRRAFVADAEQNVIHTIDLDTDAVTTSTFLGVRQEFFQATLSPDERLLYLTSQLSNLIHVFDVTQAGSPVFVRSVFAALDPGQPVFTADGTTVYIPSAEEDALIVMETETNSVVEVRRGEGLSEPVATARSADGQTVYVANRNRQLPPERGTVAVLDAATGRVLITLPVDRDPVALAGAPSL